jgi:thymidylate kinase
MIIMIEGCDRTGKTTLAKMLAEKLGGQVIHTSKPQTDNPYVEYLEKLASLPRHKILIFDRFYLGEYVYSILWRGGCKISSEQFKKLDHVAANLHKAVVIHACASTETIIERCRREGEELLQEDQVEQCADLFNQIIYHTDLPVITYDSDSQKAEDIVEMVENYV